MTYNLNDNVSESFEFELDGNKYVMKYPTVSEIEKIDDILKKSDDDEDVVADYFFKFISAKDSAPDIKKALKSHNVKVLKNFNQMVKTEFGFDQ